MSLKEIYQKARLSLVRSVRFFTAENTSSIADAPLLPNWYMFATLGVPRKINTIELRQYAKSAWVQMVKRTVKNQIVTTEWDIVNSNEEDETDYSEDIEKAKTLLESPNRNGDTFGSLWGAYVDDIMDLDAGVIWKGKNVAGELVELFAHDGSRFLTKIDEHGLIDGYFQYSFRMPAGAPLFFKKKDIIYGRIGVNTDQFPYGWSPLQSIQQVVELMIQSDRFNKEFFQNNAVPDGMMSVPMDDDALDRFKSYWKKEVKGQPHKFIFTNAMNAAFTPFSMSNKDMQWLDGQKWYFHVVFGAYGLSPAEVGFYEDVNRASQEGQERVSVKNAIRPYLNNIEEKINREIFPDLIGHDKIKFKWFPKDDQAEQLDHEQTMKKLEQNVLTINEVRAKEGLKPVDWGDQPFQFSTQDRFIENGGTESFEGKKETFGNKKEEAEGKDSKKLYKRLFLSFIKNG